MSKEQAAARAKLLRAWGRAFPSDRMFLAIVYADKGRKHTRTILREIQKLRARVQELEDAAFAWDRA